MGIEKRMKGFFLNVEFEALGGRLGILGASGCGKSMTLKCIAGIQTPDKGSIVVNDRVLFDSEKRINLKPQQRKVGYLFQSYALFPNMTAEQNIACGLKGKETNRSRLEEITGMFRIENLMKRYPSQLSGGQQQRVALARMLMYDPEVMLLDEPFSALDAYLREELQLQLLELFLHFGKDVILVTHNRDEVYKLCDQLMVLDGGQALKIGNTREMFEKPQLLQVARLTGCKNVSTARKTGEHMLYAKDWNVALISSQEVSDSVTHVGIRAHDFVPTEKEAGGNIFAVEPISRAEDPFETNVIFRCRGTKSEIWWKYARQELVMPTHFYVHPDDVLPLTDGA